MSSDATSAEYLIAFYREISSANLPPEIVADLMHQAGQALLLDMGSIVVKAATHV